MGAPFRGSLHGLPCKYDTRWRRFSKGVVQTLRDDGQAPRSGTWASQLNFPHEIADSVFAQSRL